MSEERQADPARVPSVESAPGTGSAPQRGRITEDCHPDALDLTPSDLRALCDEVTHLRAELKASRWGDLRAWQGEATEGARLQARAESAESRLRAVEAVLTALRARLLAIVVDDPEVHIELRSCAAELDACLAGPGKDSV